MLKPTYDLISAPHHGAEPLYEYREPECTCIRIDVDRYDAAGCERCDPRSPYNVMSAAAPIEYAPARPEPTVWEAPW